MKFLCTLIVLTSAFCPAYGHVPEIGQIIRFQPQILHSSKPFAVKGSFVSEKAKMESLLEWMGPGSYKLSIKDVPSRFYASGEGAGSWTLYRHGNKCSLKTDSLTVSCPSAGFWGAMELSGIASEVTSALVESGFIRDEDAQYIETDSRVTPKDPRDKNVRVSLGTNGNAPNGRSVMAVLEVRGPRYHSEVPGEEFPLLQYDQNFLSPLLARFSQEGEVVTIRALSELNVATRKTRYASILASRLEFLIGKTIRLTEIRHEPAPLKNPTSGISPPKAAADLGALKDQLSVEGQNFLRLLLVSH